MCLISQDDFSFANGLLAVVGTSLMLIQRVIHSSSEMGLGAANIQFVFEQNLFRECIISYNVVKTMFE